jgi:hypothetical protein
MPGGRLEGGNAAVEHDIEIAMCGLEPIHPCVIEWRDLAVFPGRQPFEPGLAGVHDQGCGAGRFHGIRHGVQRGFRILLVDAETAFHRHGDAHRRPHGGNARTDQMRLGHQAGAEAAFLNTIGWAADVEVDLVVAEILGNARAFGERPRIGAAELDRHRVLERIEADEPLAVAAQHRARRHHLGIEQCPTRQQPMEEPAVPVGPLHHRRDTEPMFLI